MDIIDVTPFRSYHHGKTNKREKYRQLLLLMKSVVDLQIKIHYVLHPIKLMFGLTEIPKLAATDNESPPAIVLAVLSDVQKIVNKFEKLQTNHC